MTEVGKKIHAAWYVMTAFNVVCGKMRQGEAEREALKSIIKIYGEETLRKEFELDINGNQNKTYNLP